MVRKGIDMKHDNQDGRFDLQRTRICNILIEIANNHKDLILALKRKEKDDLRLLQNQQKDTEH